MSHVSRVTRFFHCSSGDLVLVWTTADINGVSQPPVFSMITQGKCVDISRDAFCTIIHKKEFRLRAEDSVRCVSDSPVLEPMYFQACDRHYREK